jgi:DNA-binding LacI/PurR family transcriptional regulator
MNNTNNAGREYLYENIADGLRERIKSGEYGDNARLPTIRVLTEEFDTTGVTVSKALDTLEEEGYIERRPKVGMFVRPRKYWGTHTRYMRSTGLAGVIAFDTSASVFWSRAVDAMEDALRSRDLHLVIGHSDHKTDRALHYVESLLGKGVEGFVYVPMEADSPAEYVETNRPVLEMLESASAPVVLFDRTVPGWNLPSVTYDNYDAGRRAASYLVGKGCSHPMCISVQYCEAVGDRERGFLDYLSEVGIEESHEHLARFGQPLTRASVPESRSMLERFIGDTLDSRISVDGLYGVNSNVVNAITSVVTDAERALHVPIAGIRELELEMPERVGLIIDQAIYEFGYAAARLLSDILRDEEGEKVYASAGAYNAVPHLKLSFQYRVNE